MPLLTDWNCRNCFSSAHGGWEGTSTSVPFSCSRHWFCFLPWLPCLFREFFFSIHTFCFASLPFISTRTFFLFSLTTSFSIGDFFLLENPRLILDLRREIGYSLALHPNISKHILHTFSVHFFRFWKGEFVYQSRAFFFVYHFSYVGNETKESAMFRNFTFYFIKST